MRIRRTVSAKHWPRNRHLDRVHNEFPALKAALAEAQRRFSGWPGILGFGIGKKIKGKRGRIVRMRGCPGGLSVHVYVERKKSLKELARLGKSSGIEYTLPGSLLVAVPKRKTRCRVPLDVIAAGGPVTGPTRISQGGGPPRSLTQAGSTNAGRVFGLIPRPDGAPGIEAGTVGAFVRDSGTQCYAVTAGHVVVDIENPPWTITEPKVVCLAGNEQVQLPTTAFFPQRLGTPPQLIDSIVVRVSPQLAPTPPGCSWPSVFDGALATPDDTRLAFGEGREGSFLWVQRELSVDPGGTTSREPWALEVNIIGTGPFSRRSESGNVITYPDLWWYRYPLYSGDPNNPWQLSIPGDSGSGLYVRSAGNPKIWRLLGFHIYCLADPANRNWWGLAVPADQFLEMLIGKHQQNWWFYGRE